MTNKLIIVVNELNKPSQEAILRLNEAIYNLMIENELKAQLKDKNLNDSTEKTA